MKNKYCFNLEQFFCESYHKQRLTTSKLDLLIYFLETFIQAKIKNNQSINWVLWPTEVLSFISFTTLKLLKAKTKIITSMTNWQNNHNKCTHKIIKVQISKNIQHDTESYWHTNKSSSLKPLFLSLANWKIFCAWRGFPPDKENSHFVRKT